MNFLWSCCTPPSEDTSQFRIDIAIDEHTPPTGQDEPPTGTPTLLSSQPCAKPGAAEVPKLKQVEAGTENQPANLAATSAAKGKRCTFVSARTGARAAAEYVVDVDALQLVVRMSGRDGRSELAACPVMAIEDIFTIDDGEDCFPIEVLQSLTPEEKDGLFMVVHARDDLSADVTHLCLVEASRSARDDLLEYLKELTCS